jgi:hypothetical protein
VENASEREITGKIAWAFGTQDIDNIGQAAEIGMTCNLFNELVKMRDSYKRWRESLTRNDHAKGMMEKFKQWYYAELKEQEGED